MSQEVSSTNKRIAKNTLFLYVRMLLVMGVSIFTSRVILQTLGVEECLTVPCLHQPVVFWLTNWE